MFPRCDSFKGIAACPSPVPPAPRSPAVLGLDWLALARDAPVAVEGRDHCSCLYLSATGDTSLALSERPWGAFAALAARRSLSATGPDRNPIRENAEPFASRNLTMSCCGRGPVTAASSTAPLPGLRPETSERGGPTDRPVMDLVRAADISTRIEADASLRRALGPGVTSSRRLRVMAETDAHKYAKTSLLRAPERQAGIAGAEEQSCGCGGTAIPPQYRIVASSRSAASTPRRAPITTVRHKMGVNGSNSLRPKATFS